MTARLTAERSAAELRAIRLVKVQHEVEWLNRTVNLDDRRRKDVIIIVYNNSNRGFDLVYRQL